MVSRACASFPLTDDTEEQKTLGSRKTPPKHASPQKLPDSRRTQQLRDAGVDVENVVVEQRSLLRVSVMPRQDLVHQPLALRQVGGAAQQTSAELHHQTVGQELQAVHRRRHPLVGPEGEPSVTVIRLQLRIQWGAIKALRGAAGLKDKEGCFSSLAGAHMDQSGERNFSTGPVYATSKIRSLTSFWSRQVIQVIVLTL